ncbi:MAG TPA: DUF357 domain-containing protein [Methanoregula sp.]|nr:DUF357 domain-containing protein [Methanoregula sp.]
MKIEELHLLLSAALEKTRITVPPETALWACAKDQLAMARAYESDGTTFAGRGDMVNALAGFFYAFGWLHFGCAYGTLITDMPIPPCPFIRPCRRLPGAVSGKLTEKSSRYERLLTTASASVTCAPDPSTPAYLLAARTLQVAYASACQGRWFLEMKREEDALAHFSYGHGWLDAGVRAGLFTIHAHREIFTVD